MRSVRLADAKSLPVLTLIAISSAYPYMVALPLRRHDAKYANVGTCKLLAEQQNQLQHISTSQQEAGRRQTRWVVVLT